ncbi:hypothetical protein KAU11_12565 [Candidatus Babeliales bacterium]|nr:hypothetical protein [Candidatus Babeliales bacterium]
MSRRNKKTETTTAPAVTEKTTQEAPVAPVVEEKAFDIKAFMKTAKTETKKKVVQLSWYADTDKADYTLLSRLKSMNVNRESLVEQLLVDLEKQLIEAEKGEVSDVAEAV